MFRPKKKICKNCCFLFVPQDIAGVMISYTGGPIDYACFLSGDEVLLEQEATSTCGYKWEPDETNSMARNKPLETFLQEH